MNAEQIKEKLQSALQPEDELIGYFMAQQMPKFWLYLCLGPLAMVTMKTHYVGVTPKGLCFLQLNFLGNQSALDFFNYTEIESVVFGKGVLQRPTTFRFKNGRRLHIKAQLKGVEKVPKLTPELQAHIEQNISSAR